MVTPRLRFFVPLAGEVENEEGNAVVTSFSLAFRTSTRAVTTFHQLLYKAVYHPAAEKISHYRR
jgi:hypothetical protein